MSNERETSHKEISQSLGSFRNDKMNKEKKHRSPYLKVCGMRYQDNIQAIAELKPDYLGFIFWEPSSRFFEGDMPPIPYSIKKVGVFVDATIEEVLTTAEKYNLQVVQLHGKETPEYCKELRNRHAEPVYRQGRLVSASHNEKKKSVMSNLPRRQTGERETSHQKISQSLRSSRNDKKIEIIKVFSIKDDFNFEILTPYEAACDYYLFDTKGKLPGGNGYTFDWKVLEDYPSKKPFFLSGGIGLEEIDKIMAILKTDLPIYAIDVNSRFEAAPGLKKTEKLKKFKELLYENV